MLKLIPGKQFRVSGFEKSCDHDYRHKLLAMGFIPGTQFKVLRIAPLGDPVEIEMNGFLLSLRAKESQIMQLESVNE